MALPRAAALGDAQKACCNAAGSDMPVHRSGGARREVRSGCDAAGCKLRSRRQV
eukprot:CAMPEP_0179943528 /NCGR_PEP_ID=MMETSP0983-20121128/18360_1 /TAXON_ID=483367 /ORGANISM="non described non described, Strain CCMP 2436" /LENGTH=53 /DNA_ID=CAMNT_0021851227 /DNA_START=729 /DNA_END=887 /DNA_ORIENTATION=+